MRSDQTTLVRDAEVAMKTKSIQKNKTDLQKILSQHKYKKSHKHELFNSLLPTAKTSLNHILAYVHQQGVEVDIASLTSILQHPGDKKAISILDSNINVLIKICQEYPMISFSSLSCLLSRSTKKNLKKNIDDLALCINQLVDIYNANQQYHIKFSSLSSMIRGSFHYQEAINGLASGIADLVTLIQVHQIDFATLSMILGGSGTSIKKTIAILVDNIDRLIHLSGDNIPFTSLACIISNNLVDLEENITFLENHLNRLKKICNEYHVEFSTLAGFLQRAGNHLENKLDQLDQDEALQKELKNMQAIKMQKLFFTHFPVHNINIDKKLDNLLNEYHIEIQNDFRHTLQNASKTLKNEFYQIILMLKQCDLLHQNSFNLLIAHAKDDYISQLNKILATMQRDQQLNQDSFVKLLRGMPESFDVLPKLSLARIQEIPLQRVQEVIGALNELQNHHLFQYDNCVQHIIQNADIAKDIQRALLQSRLSDMSMLMNEQGLESVIKAVRSRQGKSVFKKPGVMFHDPINENLKSLLSANESGMNMEYKL